MNDVFRARIEGCLSAIQDRIATCLEEARLANDIPAESDCRPMAGLLVDCWEGAALRREGGPLTAMLDLYFGVGLGGPSSGSARG